MYPVSKKYSRKCLGYLKHMKWIYLYTPIASLDPASYQSPMPWTHILVAASTEQKRIKKTTDPLLSMYQMETAVLTEKLLLAGNCDLWPESVSDTNNNAEV